MLHNIVRMNDSGRDGRPHTRLQARKRGSLRLTDVHCRSQKAIQRNDLFIDCGYREIAHCHLLRLDGSSGGYVRSALLRCWE
jgi:hypothetical protein